ncbi:lathosterol oxidase-like isoform X2 [Pomacea canaliculata]|uniref:lathosterol oxidase-like isoform X2 n=1 Tax=Pomacea canaliculata TaxID=400727 RepID=UPI000D725CAE|nr:lathosterol oxidase-like isoform X2 [Pomacea canaliculata]XP_025100762.1 lathosterol oxidase-like isoform X2 [Pomacea canaliculata]XP_025100763.1 lathosterol oxidase-like isoform X2 [Pomacea canaliculata]
MDLVLHTVDYYFLTPYVYSKDWPEDDPWRQLISLFLIASVGGYLLYFAMATISFYAVYDQRLLEHPQILRNQIRREIICTVKSVPLMSILTVAVFFVEVRGYSKLYDNVGDSPLGWFWVVLSCFTFVAFTDAFIYWIHRGLHHRSVYRYLHKTHHTWKVPTPFASHAFHPVDGFLQSCPYHIYPFLFPLHKVTYLVLFVFVNFWTVSIHDGVYSVPKCLQPFINGSAHHTDHHLFYNYNYGQFFTLWDHIGGSFCNPTAFEGRGPLDEVLNKKKLKCDSEKQVTNGDTKKEN